MSRSKPQRIDPVVSIPPVVVDGIEYDRKCSLCGKLDGGGFGRGVAHFANCGYLALVKAVRQ